MGCSITNGWPGSGSAAIACPTEPWGSTPAATVRAPRTPIEVCTRWGRKLRVVMVPPRRGALRSTIFGTVVSDTSPSPISPAAAKRIRSSRSRRTASPSSSAGSSSPRSPRSAARISTVGMPLSTHETRMEPEAASRSSATAPVGNSAPVEDPAVPSKSSMIAPAVPGTLSIARSPSYSTRPEGVAKVAVAMPPVLTMRIRTLVRSGSARTSPRSIANGPTPASRLPQFCRSVTKASSTPTCRKR